MVPVPCIPMEAVPPAIIPARAGQTFARVGTIAAEQQVAQQLLCFSGVEIRQHLFVVANAQLVK